MWLTPEQFVAILGAVTAAIVAIGGLYVQIRQLRAQVNGRLTELLESTRVGSLAQGKLEGLGHAPAGAEPPPLAPPSAP